jgi:hypothetical protein
MESLAFHRADHEGTGETLADTDGLSKVEIAAALFWEASEPLRLDLILMPIPFPRENPDFEQSTDND